MAIIYYKKIKSGKITIDDVPERWRKEVYALLKENRFFIFFPPLLMHKAKKVSTLSNKILFG